MAKKLVVFTLSFLLLTSFFAFTAYAQTPANNLLWGNQEGAVQSGTGLGNNDPRTIAAKAINILLGFMGIIAVVIILLGGFRWMTAAGNEDKVAEAKRIIGAGVIGLVIVLTSFGLAQFILNALYGATGANG